MIKFNINENIKVKLTPLGVFTLTKHDPHIKADKDGYYVIQLWEVMNIFGIYLYNGAPQYFINNEITFISN